MLDGKSILVTGGTEFSVVRYGNVAGSRGSVIPFFQELVRNGATELPITSMRMPDLAAAIAPELRTVEVGIRPGEKIHECMITREDARNTVEREGYYIILPQIQHKNIDRFYTNDKRVPEDFEYMSRTQDGVEILNYRDFIDRLWGDKLIDVSSVALA